MPCPRFRGAWLSAVLLVAVSLLASSCGSPKGTALRLAPDRERDGRRVFIATEDWFFCDARTRELYRVPLGYETDFASIPGLARWIVGSDRAQEAALIHDYLYAVGVQGDEVARKKADDVFLRALEEKRIPAWKRTAMYRTVRMKGSRAFGRGTEWDNFADPATSRPACPSLARPQSAVVAVMDCDVFMRDFTHIEATYALNLPVLPRAEDGSCKAEDAIAASR